MDVIDVNVSHVNCHCNAIWAFTPNDEYSINFFSGFTLSYKIRSIRKIIYKLYSIYYICVNARRAYFRTHWHDRNTNKRVHEMSQNMLNMYL